MRWLSHRAVLGCALAAVTLQNIGIAQQPSKRPPDANVNLDQFGNPVGDYGLAQDGQFAGKKLLVWCHWGPVRKSLLAAENPLWKALKRKGFEIRLEFARFDPSWLDEVDQLWIVSGPKPEFRTPTLVRELSPSHSVLSPSDMDAVERFLKSGRGVYVLADDTPVYEADILARRWFDTGIQGNYRGEKIASVRDRKLTRSMRRKYEAEYQVDDHALLTGVNFIWEGTTVSHLQYSRRLESAMTASDGRSLVAVSKNERMRIVFDCGMTRYYRQVINKAPGAIRLAENVAAYLMKGVR